MLWAIFKVDFTSPNQFSYKSFASWSSRTNPEDQINKKPKDQKNGGFGCGGGLSGSCLWLTHIFANNFSVIFFFVVDVIVEPLSISLLEGTVLLREQIFNLSPVSKRLALFALPPSFSFWTLVIKQANSWKNKSTRGRFEPGSVKT